MTLDEFIEQKFCVRCDQYRRDNAWSAILCKDCWEKEVGYIPPEPHCVKCGKVDYRTDRSGQCEQCWLDSRESPEKKRGKK